VRSLDFPWRVVADLGATLELQSSQATMRIAATESLETPPVVGDYVALDERVRRVVAIRPRSSWIARTRAKGDPQFIAANVTTAFVVTSPESRELSPRRITRYLIALRSGHVEPVVLLNKCETDAVLAEHLNALRAIAEAAPVLPISARDGAGCEALSPYLTDQATVVLCGSSGVGKSTLLNRLCGTPVMPTADMREDGRGRHTTTVRRLITLPGGATLIDTPGMRAFTPWAQSADVDEAFADITEAAARCRFADCRHESEPGCALRDGVSDERLTQWRKLRRETEWMSTRENPLVLQERKRYYKRIHKAVRAMGSRWERD
jgi:ribosome biogenesis GTPase